MGILLTAHEEGRQIGVPAVEPARRIRIPLRQPRGWTGDEWVAFWPLTFTVFETQCLADISQFLAELMATRKAEA